jgi:N6-L-threonylcarbamoyladenine synthase
MICLGVETSCDETALALVRDGVLLGERLASQEDLHALFGGVVPELASREHLRKGSALFPALIKETGVDPEDIGAVAVARGPGLLGSLLVGMNLAKGLALGLGTGFVGVNHLHAHLLVVGLEREIPFPSVGLLISGGHTQLYLVHSPFDFELLGRTLDDAAGEALDKAAKLVNLPYPGGKFIDFLGQGEEPDKTLFPRPLTSGSGLDFSFSGLKSAVARYVSGHPSLKLPTLPGEVLPEVPGLPRYCATINWAVADTLRIKAERALAAHPEAKALIVAGGVAANSMIRREMIGLCAASGVEAVFPSPRLCTDNAAMIAFLGEQLVRAGFVHGLDLLAIPRGRMVPLDYTRPSS